MTAQTEEVSPGEQARAWVARRDPARWTLGAVIVVWSLTFIILGFQRHDRYGTFGFDLGTYDQGIWLLSQLKHPFVTIRGLHLFGHHVNFILYLLAPFYRLGAGPHFLLVVQVLSQASGAIAVFLLARDRLKSRWLAVAMGTALLLHPTSGWLAWEFFHPDALAIGPLLFAYWAARAGRWRWFTVAAVAAILCKEDVAFSMAMIGVLIFFRGNRRIGAVTALASLAWYELSTKVILPANNHIAAFYNTFFGDLGESPFEVLKSFFTKPNEIRRLLRMDDRRDYTVMMLAPMAFLPLASLSTFLIAVPMLAINLLSTFPYQREIRYHYAALVLVGVMVATVEAIANLGERPGFRRFLVGLVMASSLATTVAWGNAPISVKFHNGIWSLGADARRQAKHDALALIPKHDSVSAIYYMAPHLTHRTKVYEFPNPWKVVNWGVRGENPDDPGGVKWLILDRQLLSAEDRELLHTLLTTEFQLRYDHNDILVARRTHPPGPDSPKPPS
jgi:uncharacterized membrane protein